MLDCQKDSGTTRENGTPVKPVLLAVKIFAVYLHALFDTTYLQGRRKLLKTGWAKPEAAENWVGKTRLFIFLTSE